MAKKVKKVVIPVAGVGTRGLPFTKEVPKEMLPIIDTPGIHFIVEEVLAAGIEQVIFVTSKGKSSLEDYFDPSPALEAFLRGRGKGALADRVKQIGQMAQVISVRQKEPLGLGHAILCAKSIVGDEPFAVCLGDEIFPAWDLPAKDRGGALRELVEHRDRIGASVVGVMEVELQDTSSYGIVDTKGAGFDKGPVKVVGTVEKPKPEAAPSRYAIIGRYVFEASLFEELERTKPGVGGEIQLTDAMDKLCQQGRLWAHRVQSRRYDIGNHFSYLQAQIEASLLRPELAERVRRYLKTI